MFIKALETVTETSVLANPKLLVVNKQRGEIIVGKRDGYLTTTVTDTVATQTVQFLETGTKMVVRPFIAKDGFIRMEIHPEQSDGHIELFDKNALPTQTTTEVTSNVMVRDGRTIVIGGLFKEESNPTRSQIPILGNIPYLGTVFRQTSDVAKRNEIIVLLTPHIIKHDVDEGVSEQLKDDVERFRIGARKGLRCWSAQRLAETHVRWAKEALREGKRDRALWNLDLALACDPRQVDAIRLKEQVTQKAYWSDLPRNSAANHVIQRMIMQELGKPVERIIPPDKPLDADRVDPDVRKALGIQQRIQDPLPGPARPAVPLKIETGTPHVPNATSRPADK